MFGSPQWSPKKWLLVISLALAIWLVFAFIGPGDDYKRCYTDMVQAPWRLQLVQELPWTQNPPWLAPFMAPFISIPGRAGYIVFIAATLAATILTTYLLGGKPVPVLLSAHLFWILWWGQIEIWGMLAIVIGCLAVQRKSWHIMFLALILASFKPQISLIPVSALWWWTGRDRWKSLVGMFALFIFSLWAWGAWPIWYAGSIINFIGDGHSSPWEASIGLFAIPLFLPAIWLPLSREKRLIALAATTYIASPYMPYYSMIPLLTFAIPWWAYGFAFLGFLPSLIGTRLAWNSLVLLPISVLLWTYWPLVSVWVKRLIQSRQAQSPLERAGS